MTPRVVAAVWLVVGIALWNGVFDLYVSRGEREYLQKRAEFDAGIETAPEPPLAAIMAQARRHGAIAASIWAALVTGLGLATVALAPRLVAARERRVRGTDAT